MITNESILNRAWLADMYADSFYPPALVDKGRAILLDLCEKIEQQRPVGLDALYVLTHAATRRFSDLDEELNAVDSEIETVAREAIGADFDFIATAYGFDADTEELIAPRDW